MNKKKNRFLLLFLIISVIILLIAVVIVLSIQYNLLGYIDNINKKPTLYVIQDECGTILNNLMHSIQNRDECKIRCNNECNMRGTEYSSLEFINNTGICYTCNCYCK